MTLLKINRNRDFFPTFPSFFESNFDRDLFDFSPFHRGNTAPAVNIKEKEKEFIVELAVPGKKKEDFKIELNNNVLSISSEKENKVEEKDKEGNYTRREFSFHSFKRSFTLPEKTETDKISASYTDGILSISVPKREEAKANLTKTIDVK